MLPEERDALLAERRRTTRGVMVVSAVLAAVVGVIVVMGLAKADFTQHVLGGSTEQQAVVTDIDKVDFCSRNNRDTYTLEWTEDGQARSETIGRCGDPFEVGETVDIWSTDGAPETASPMRVRLALLALLVALGALGAYVVLRAGRHRRTIDAVLAGHWQPLTCHTVGDPGDPRFRVLEAPEPVRAHSVHKGRCIHATPHRADQSGQMPGTLFLTGLRRGRPRGLSLHTGADGSRTWRQHGEA